MIDPSLPLVLCLSFGAKSTYRQSSIKLFCDILVNILTHITKHVRLPLIVVHTVQIQHIHSFLHVIVFDRCSWQFDRCSCSCGCSCSCSIFFAPYVRHRTAPNWDDIYGWFVIVWYDVHWFIIVCSSLFALYFILIQ
eukprot:934299_1